MKRITKETAARTASTIKYHNGDLSAAAHDCRISLTSIRPYTDRGTSAVLEVLEYIGRPGRTAADLERLLSQLETIATGGTNGAQS